ncbi:MAG: LysR family transcriptional regulator [Acidobacteriota bacterium]
MSQTQSLNRNHLALFRAVAEHGSITAASKALRISQPAVSSQISSLERRLGGALFDRMPRGARLTPLGEVLVGYARRIGQLEVEAVDAVADFLGRRTGRLAVGASTSIGSYFLPEIMGELARRYPGVQLSLRIDNTEGIQRDLTDGTLDVGLTEGFASEEDFDVAIFRDDVLRLIAPADHPLVQGGPVPLDEVLAYPLLAREPGSGTRAIVERAFARAGVEAPPKMSLGSSEALKRAVAAGLGVAWVSELALAFELNAGVLKIVPVADFSIRRPLHRLLVRGRTPAPTIEAFEDLLRAA